MKAVDRGLGVQVGDLEAALHRTAVARFQLQIKKAFQGGGEAKVVRRRFLQGRLQMLAQGGKLQLFEFLFQRGHGIPFGHRG